MKLKTSLFDATVLKKDLTRYAPLWGIYTVLMLLFLLLVGSADGTGQNLMDTAPYVMQLMGVLNMVYGFLAALLLFGDLHKSRMCNMLHAMPLRREGWFFTHLAAGLLFCLVPNTLGALIASAMLGQYAYGAFLWLALMVMEYLFFFGVGCFSALCAGSVHGTYIIYGILNVLGVLVSFLVNTFFMPYLEGVRLNEEPFLYLCPVSILSSRLFLELTHDENTHTLLKTELIGADWLYLGIIAAVGIALLGLALLLYRKRHLESAGSLVAFRPAAPVFLTLYALVVGAVFHLIGSLEDSGLGILFLVVGLALGYFTGKMLLEKKVNVFRPKNFLGFGILAATLGLLIGLTVLDPLGVTQYVPDPQQVKSITVSPYLINDYYMLVEDTFQTADAEDIAQITQLHKAILDDTKTESTATQTLSLSYQLKSGTTITRSYQVDLTTQEAEVLRSFFSRPMTILHSDNPEALLPRITSIHISRYDKEESKAVYYYRNDTVSLDFKQTENEYVVEGSFADHPELRSLVEALFADSRAGDLPQQYTNEEPLGYVSINFIGIDTHDYLFVSFYPSSAHTRACLDALTP